MEWGNKLINTQVPNNNLKMINFLRLINYMKYKVSNYLYWHKKYEEFSTISEILEDVKFVVKDTFEFGKLNNTYIYSISEINNELHLNLSDKKDMSLSKIIIWDMEMINSFEKLDFEEEEGGDEE
jgi:hypothetical protein